MKANSGCDDALNSKRVIAITEFIPGFKCHIYNYIQVWNILHAKNKTKQNNYLANSFNLHSGNGDTVKLCRLAMKNFIRSWFSKNLALTSSPGLLV